jgi:ferredoxin
MKYDLTSHQLNKLVEIISKSYDTYAPQAVGGRVVLKKVDGISNLRLFSKTTVLPFKKIIFSNESEFEAPPEQRLIALLGLHICDVHALHIFLKQFTEFKSIPQRDKLLIVASECKPDENCFCEVFGANRLDGFDIYLQKEKGEQLSAFTNSELGEDILEAAEIISAEDQTDPRPIKHDDDDFEYSLENTISRRADFEDFWRKIANNCFGCGACTAVCPLCFCFRQDYKNNLDGSSQVCLKWDSCFAKGFSEIQMRKDLRPENVDRLYNWYHHKFVRGKHELGRFLCIGCGRCITACPANLNIKNILGALDEKVERKIKNGQSVD